MIKLATKQKKTLKGIDKSLEGLQAQARHLTAQRNSYILSILEGNDVGDKEYELNKNYDLEEVVEETE